jgi:hypothetical protein
MMRISEFEDAQSDPRLTLSEPGLAYQTFATPSRYEPASLSTDLAGTILNALSRDDGLRLAQTRQARQRLSRPYSSRSCRAVED